ncbi:MAG: GspH/FimT family pseudopilin [Candidatus Thiodiazotropha sp.]
MQRNASHCRAGKQCGLTLLNLLMSLALVAIALTLGVPSFNTLSARSQQTAEINRFITHLQLARSYAVKTGRDHVLCPSRDNRTCLDMPDWKQGYILFEDKDENGVRSATELLVHVSRPTGKVGIEMQSTSGRNHVVYRADGHSEGSNLTLTFCDPESDIPPKAVILSNTGRSRISNTRWDGSPLSCGH